MNAADLVLRSSAILAIGLLAHVVLGRRSAALRHFVLAATIFLSALVVPLSLTLPSWDVRLPSWPQRGTEVSSVVTVTGTRAAVDAPSGSTGVDFETVAMIGWGVGFAIAALLLLVECRRLVRTSARAI